MFNELFNLKPCNEHFEQSALIDIFKIPMKSYEEIALKLPTV